MRIFEITSLAVLKNLRSEPSSAAVGDCSPDWGSNAAASLRLCAAAYTAYEQFSFQLINCALSVDFPVLQQCSKQINAILEIGAYPGDCIDWFRPLSPTEGKLTAAKNSHPRINVTRQTNGPLRGRKTRQSVYFSTRLLLSTCSTYIDDVLGWPILQFHRRYRETIMRRCKNRMR